MKTILFVKTSSLGDVVHNCPAVSDAARAVPGVQIDWIVEEPFAGIARMHGAVRRVIPVGIRRWRSTSWKPSTWTEIGAWRRALGAERYDAVIDTQSLVKSAVLCAAAKGTRHGLDRASARELLATAFYDVRHAVPRGLHAVERNRRLAAKALGYAVHGAADYGLHSKSEKSERIVLLTMTSREDKLWPETRWIELARALGRRVVLPWGSDDERARAGRIANALDAATVLPRSSLEDLARLFSGAYRVIGLDTGLTHLAAAVGVPTIGIFCGSDPALTGLYAPNAKNVGAAGRAPAVGEVLELAR
jgi:heptosyltransferase-1